MNTVLNLLNLALTLLGTGILIISWVVLFTGILLVDPSGETFVFCSAVFLVGSLLGCAPLFLSTIIE